MGIVFAAPMVLTALIGLPVLWVILRALPPKPKTVIFSAVTLLQGLKDRETTAAKTPLWLIILRSIAVAAVIIALAGPRIDRGDIAHAPNDTLILLDGGWAMAQHADAARDYVVTMLRAAEAGTQRFAVLDAAEPNAPIWQTAQDTAALLRDWSPKPVALDWAAVTATLDSLPQTGFDVVWLSDGLDYGSARADIYDRLGAANVEVFEPLADRLWIRSVATDTGDTVVRVSSIGGGIPAAQLRVLGVDPKGLPIVIEDIPIVEDRENTDQDIRFRLPAELLSRVTKFQILGQSHVGGHFVLADQLRRPKVALLSAQSQSETEQILDPLYYVSTAISPFADLQTPDVGDILIGTPDVLIAADVVRVPQAEDVLDWVTSGGTLIRFAGPRMAAAAQDLRDDPLMPVALRQGGRNFGGAMSWDTPKSLAPFDADKGFGGLKAPDDVRITAQILAQPEVTLDEKTMAALEDRTPLVTQSKMGAGRVVLFHTTANATWSNLPLSGVFVDMLTRLIRPSFSAQGTPAIEGRKWTPVRTLDVYGQLRSNDALAAVEGAVLAQGQFDDATPLGIYTAQDHSISRNLSDIFASLSPALWPDGAKIIREPVIPEIRDLRALFFVVAFAALCVDVVASLWVTGRFVAAMVCLALPLSLSGVSEVQAQDRIPDEIALAHIITGERRVDDTALAGLRGLTAVLTARTSIEPADPVSVDLERDDLALYPLLYWPITASQPLPSDAAYAKLNTFMASGGVILFDTRDANQGGRDTAEGQTMRRLANKLVIPRLDRVPSDHVLTRAFYLLQSFPGRYADGQLWIEAAPPETALDPDRPFRDLNDGVTPVLIGGNDWAAAWAVDDTGQPLVLIGRGYAGERQREMAYRFGVNLVMHVLMGNYKSDQVHVPALLERLGQ